MKVKIWMVEHYSCQSGRNSSTSWFYSTNLNKDIEYSIRQHIQELHEDGCEYQSSEYGVFDLENFRKSIADNSSQYLIPVD